MTLLRTNRKLFDVTLLALRLAMGVVMFPHGAQKMLGWFGGYGFAGTMQFFTGTMHIPALFAVLAILAEFVGSILLIAGALTRFAALAITANLLVAASVTHLAANGFFMNWTGQQKGEGIEYFIYAVVVGVVLIAAGAGKYSVDALFSGDENADVLEHDTRVAA